jgi:hypothetical protein
MTVANAKRAARDWVHEHAAEVPGLWGAIFGGSINWLPEDTELGACSDIDLWHLIKGPIDPGLRQRKIIHEGLLLEPAYIPFDVITDAKTSLGNWWCGCHLAVPSVIHDPSGQLTAIQREVAEHFAEPAWIRRRCQTMASMIRSNYVPRMTTGQPSADQCCAFFFAVNEICHIPIVASLKPPTVRRGGEVFTELARSLGQEPVSQLRFELLGSAGMSREDVEGMLGESTVAWDRAVQVRRAPLSFGEWDLCPAARPHVIGGARDLIDRGYHREAALWILYTHWLARAVLEIEASEEWRRRFQEPYARLLVSLGIGSPGGFAQKTHLIEELLARTMTLAESIIEGTAARRS